jgi:hypothetical protein
MRIEKGSSPTDAFLAEVNSLLLQHPRHTSLHKRDGMVIREPLFEPRSPPTYGSRSSMPRLIFLLKRSRRAFANANLVSSISLTRARKAHVDGAV